MAVLRRIWRRTVTCWRAFYSTIPDSSKRRVGDVTFACCEPALINQVVLRQEAFSVSNLVVRMSRFCGRGVHRELCKLESFNEFFWAQTRNQTCKLQPQPHAKMVRHTHTQTLLSCRASLHPLSLFAGAILIKSAVLQQWPAPFFIKLRTRTRGPHSTVENCICYYRVLAPNPTRAL
jgi:hypothetical protein